MASNGLHEPKKHRKLSENTSLFFSSSKREIMLQVTRKVDRPCKKEGPATECRKALRKSPRLTKRRWSLRAVTQTNRIAKLPSNRVAETVACAVHSSVRSSNTYQSRLELFSLRGALGCGRPHIKDRPISFETTVQKH